MTPWWVSLVAAGIAVLGGAVGAGITHWLTARRDRTAFERLTTRQDAEWRRQREDKLRDMLAELYLNVMQHLVNLDVRLEEELDEHHEGERIPGVDSEAELSVRVDLYAPIDIRLAWQDAVARFHAVEAEWRDTGGLEEVSPSTVESAQVAIRHLREHLRHEVQHP